MSIVGVDTGSGDAVAEVRDVGNALLLVHDQLFDHVQILGARHERQLLRHRAIGAAVVHVHVEIAAVPSSGRQIHEAMHGDAQRLRSLRGHLHAVCVASAYSSPCVTSTVIAPAGTVSVDVPDVW